MTTPDHEHEWMGIAFGDGREESHCTTCQEVRLLQGPRTATRPAVASEGLREAAIRACEEHYDHEHVNAIPPCAAAMRDAEWWQAALADAYGPDMDFDEVTDGIIERGLRKALRGLVEAVDRLDDPTFTVDALADAIKQARAALARGQS